ncbi:MAG: hypothetical protein JO287_16945 [Pseudonocardiales bacterium]|nr:hypothetical protein [Pseudonocardiales bacterium]
MPSLRCRAGVPAGVAASVLLTLALAGCGSNDTKSPPAAAQGADPVAWTGTFCGGLGDVISGVAAIATSDPTPQGHKNVLLEFSDIAQRAFTNTAQKLEKLGPPRVADGKHVQDTAVGFFTTAAGTIGDQRAKLAALDAQDPDFVNKASHLAGPDLSGASAQMQGLTSNPQLAPAFRTAPECKQLAAAAGAK